MKMTAARAATIGALIFLSAGAVWLAVAQKSVGADGQKSPGWERINSAATKASTGDPIAVGALADEVLADDGIDASMEPLHSTIKTRLVSAEIEYQKGNSKGLTEQNVVSAVNGLATHFNAPSYAFTNVDEVRHLRLKMVTLFPKLMGRGPAATRDDSKPHFDKRMSPIEAFHTAATLICQKVFNPEFQATPDEKQTALQKASTASATGTASLVGDSSHRNNERTREMLNLIHQERATNPIDLLNQADQSLDSLGLRR